MQQLIQLYKEQFGRNPLRVESLPKSGSNREYVRLCGPDGTSVIGVIGPDKAENVCFIYLSRHFADKGLPVPVICAVSEDASRYLQTDLGSVSLYQALSRGRSAGARYDEEEKELIRRTIRLLPHLQVTGAEGLDCSHLLSPVRFDHRTAMFDLNYFRYCFLRPTGLVCDEVRLDDDFSDFACHLLGDENQQVVTFLYRDFQARNVMLTPAAEGRLSPCFIDYQGGQCGPLQYDVASFLWQASARYPKALREEMINEYMDELSKLMIFDRELFLRRLHSFVLFRTMQVLGAYGLRGYFERKKYFLDSIPLAIVNLRELLASGTAADWPYMEEVLRRLTELPQFDSSRVDMRKKHPEDKADSSEAALPSLVVEVLSFSYRKGIPEDTSGNGGGYVFDCRAVHNPGRYEPYRQLTGMDAPVIDFLESDGEILVFLDSVFKLADAHVERYIRRGFTHLQFAFGCTGGQHRSVYSAQHLAEHLHCKYGIEVRLIHREQQVSRTFPARTGQ